MLDLVDGRELRCELNGERTHDRCVGVCYLDGADIAAIIVRQGLARDCERFGGGRYRAAERQAAAEGATIRASYPLPSYCGGSLPDPTAALINLVSAGANLLDWRGSWAPTLVEVLGGMQVVGRGSVIGLDAGDD
jgi:hypothetical protein